MSPMAVVIVANSSANSARCLARSEVLMRVVRLDVPPNVLPATPRLVGGAPTEGPTPF